MPIDPKSMSRSEMFHEVRHGKMFKKTSRKHGVKKARKQMIARVLEAERKGKKSGRSRSRS